jgi:hemerythrin-like metal-binding protein
MQHQRLIALCNRAADCAASCALESQSEFHEILNELATLVGEHFNVEETFLQRNNSPSLKVHIAAHDTYREFVTNLLVEGAAGLLDRAKLHQVANDYLIQHMLTMDAAEKAYLQA